MLITLEQEERLSPISGYVQGAPEMVLNAKMGVMGRGQKMCVFRLPRDRPAGKAPLQTDLALGTGHTGADALEVGIGADGPTRILHTATGRGTLAGEKRDGDVNNTSPKSRSVHVHGQQPLA